MILNNIQSPITTMIIQSLQAGDSVLLSGDIYTGRDAAHKRMAELLDRGEPLPFDVEGQAIYYAGPCPAPPGRPIGSVGPTTSGRMDAYAPRLIREGLRVMIGKGERSAAVKAAIRECAGLYLAAVGGAGALISQRVERSELVAFGDLGTEAIYRLTVRDMPLVVAIDSRGGDVYDRPQPDSLGRLEIRECGAESVSLLAAMNQRLIEDEKADTKLSMPQLETRMLGFLNGGYKAYMFYRDGAAAGYALCDFSKSPPYLRHFYIERRERRKGLGTRAFHALLARLGINEIDLDAFVWNKAGVAFWESLGFEKRCYYMRYRKGTE